MGRDPGPVRGWGVSYDREALRRQLRLHECFVPHAYRDSEGYWTIGIGRLIDKAKGGRITEDEAYYLLENDIIAKEGELFSRLPWVRDLDDARQRVLLDMAFNLGIGGLLGFKNTLRCIEQGRYAQAAENMLQSKWSGQVGKRARRLSDAMETGRLEI